MRGADGYKNARFANLEPAEAVNNCGAVDGELFVKLLADFAHFSEGHRFVRFVIEIESGSIVRLVADETVECDDGAVRGSANVANKSCRIDGFAD